MYDIWVLCSLLFHMRRSWVRLGWAGIELGRVFSVEWWRSCWHTFKVRALNLGRSTLRVNVQSRFNSPRFRCDTEGQRHTLQEQTTFREIWIPISHAKHCSWIDVTRHHSLTVMCSFRSAKEKPLTWSAAVEVLALGAGGRRKSSHALPRQKMSEQTWNLHCNTPKLAEESCHRDWCTVWRSRWSAAATKKKSRHWYWHTVLLLSKISTGWGRKAAIKSRHSLVVLRLGAHFEGFRGAGRDFEVFWVFCFVSDVETQTPHCVHVMTLVDNADHHRFIAGIHFTAAYLLPMPTNPGFVFTPPPLHAWSRIHLRDRSPPCWLSFLSPKFACRSLLRHGPPSGCRRSEDFLVWGSALPFYFVVLYFAFFWRLLGFRECSHCSWAHCFARGSVLEFWELCEHAQCTWYCTISIDSAWGVTCDQMDDILTTSNVGVTWDKV